MALQIIYSVSCACTCSKLKLLMMLALVGMASLSTAAAAASRSSPSKLKYYIHVSLDRSTAYIPSKPVNATPTFGQLAVFSYKATRKEDFNSTEVGSIRGLEVYNSWDPSERSVLVLNTVSYDDGKYSGSISLHGQANINFTNYDISVVGGTGDFQGVRGYAAITNLGTDHDFKDELHFLFKHELHFL